MAVPLAMVAALLGVAAAVRKLVQAPVGLLLAVLGCGMVVAVIVSAQRARRAEAMVRREREAAWAAGLQKITVAVNAVETSVLWTADQLCQGETPLFPHSPGPVDDADAAGKVVELLSELQMQAAASLVRVHEESRAAVLLGMLRHLSRREHALVDRALGALTDLQKLTDDPEMLDRIFTIDHLVTRMRRLVESKAVLGGESLRSTRRPMNVTTLLRGACSEVVEYGRVQRAAGAVGVELGLPGHVGPDLSHLLAELIENSLEFSDPGKKVQVRAEKVAAGLAIEVEDRAMPMTARLRSRLNALLADPDTVDVSAQVRDGHIGLLTAAKIAQRHGLSVRLSENPTGGTTALVVVPARHLVALRPEAPTSAAAPLPVPQRPTATPTGTRRASTGMSVFPAQAQPHANASTPAPSSAQLAEERPPLPRRTPSSVPVPQAAARTQAPASAASAGLAAAFHRGQQTARTRGTTAASAEQASGPGGPPFPHL